MKKREIWFREGRWGSVYPANWKAYAFGAALFAFISLSWLGLIFLNAASGWFSAPLIIAFFAGVLISAFKTGKIDPS